MVNATLSNTAFWDNDLTQIKDLPELATEQLEQLLHMEKKERLGLA